MRPIVIPCDTRRARMKVCCERLLVLLLNEARPESRMTPVAKTPETGANCELPEQQHTNSG